MDERRMDEISRTTESVLKNGTRWFMVGRQGDGDADEVIEPVFTVLGWKRKVMKDGSAKYTKPGPKVVK